MGDDESSDLLIFKLREGKGLEEVEEAAPLSAEAAEAEKLPEEDMGESGPNIKVSAKGLMCSIHPWREAYAVCSKCGLPYCYVDILKKSGRFVCLDDISSVEAEDTIQNVSHNNLFTGIGGVLLVFNAAYMFYFFYPQAAVLYHSTLSSLTANGMLNLLEKYYYPSIADLIAVVISLVTGIVAMSSGRRRSSIIIGFLIFMLVSYQFMSSSGVDYLVLPIALAFVSMILFVLGNMSAARAVNALVDEEYRHVEWPRPEVF